MLLDQTNCLINKEIHVPQISSDSPFLLKLCYSLHMKGIENQILAKFYLNFSHLCFYRHYRLILVTVKCKCFIVLTDWQCSLIY